MMKTLSKKVEFGEEILVADPSCEIGSWCQKIVKNVKPGKYNCHIETDSTKREKTARRITKIAVSHESFPLNHFPSELCTDKICVDAGWAGFFDPEYFKREKITEMKKDDAFRKYCKAVASEDIAGVIDGSAVIADVRKEGLYKAYVDRDKNNNIIAVGIVFN